MSSDIASDDKMTIILIVHNVSSDDTITMILVLSVSPLPQAQFSPLACPNIHPDINSFISIHAVC
jgi:hypothetical protein